MSPKGIKTNVKAKYRNKTRPPKLKITLLLPTLQWSSLCKDFCL